MSLVISAPPCHRSTTSPTTARNTTGTMWCRPLKSTSKSLNVLLKSFTRNPNASRSSAALCDSSRGLEDVQASCASIHSDHSSGLSKTLQDYRYTPTHTFHILHSFFSYLIDFVFLIKKASFVFLWFFLSGPCFSGRMRLPWECHLCSSSS